MDSQNQHSQLKPIKEEVPVIPFESYNPNKREGPIKHFPTFQVMKVTCIQFALLTEDQNVFIIVPHHQNKDQFQCRNVAKLENTVSLQAGIHHFIALR